MGSSTERVQGRVSKREYVNRVARRAGVPVRVASVVYEAAIEELLSIVGNGDRLTLTGFGKFYPQEHKGHAVRTVFKTGATDEGEKAQIDNYAVLKFSATRSVNRQVGAEKAGVEKADTEEIDIEEDDSEEADSDSLTV